MPDVRLFLSYKTDASDPDTSTGLSQSAHMMRRVLAHLGYQVWMDKKGIEGGANWREEIREGMRNSDIVLLLLSDKSEISAGQAEEIVQALALNIKILPIVIRGNFDASSLLHNKFHLTDMQYLDFRIGHDDDLKTIINAIKGMAQELQRSIPNVIELPKIKIEVPPPNAKYATYRMEIKMPGRAPYDFPCNIHLAVGNMLLMRNIDVFVNSENAYFQMGRIFDSSTVSALLRYEGSYIEDGYVAEDTVQRELNGNNPKIPALVGKVIATSAGHPKSNLRRYKTASPRFIFHTVAVNVRGDGISKRMDAAEGPEITKCTKNTLSMIAQVNAKQGEISPPNTGVIDKNGENEDELTRQKNLKANNGYQNIKSIILPLFGSGHGNIETIDVMDPVCEGIKAFISDIVNDDEPDKWSLTDIHICVYNKKDIPIMRAKMKTHFTEVNAPENP